MARLFEEGYRSEHMYGLSRYNPQRQPGDCYCLTECTECGEFYEADKEHICKKKNSYPKIWLKHNKTEEN